MKIFKPKDDLMKSLSELTSKNAKQWYKEYLEYHNGKDQGIGYLIGYFPTVKANKLRKLLNL